MKNTNYIEPGFIVIQSNQPENLRYLLSEWIKKQPLSPFEDEIIIVHSNGMAQWLQYAFAENDNIGIATSLKMILPSSFIWQIYRAVLGNQGALKIGEKSHFDKSILVWKLYYLFGRKQFKDLNLSFLNNYLNIENFDDTNDKNKVNYTRYYLAKTLADIYDQYQVYRHDWLLHWRQNKDYFLGVKDQNLLKDEDKWQCDLWNYLTQNISNKNDDSSQWSRADLHPLFLKKINKLTAKDLITHKIKLPKRISVFGISSLSIQNIDVLYALSKFSQVIICINNPCQYYWGDLIKKKYNITYNRRDWKLQREKFWKNYNEDEPSTLGKNESTEQLDIMLDNSLLSAWGTQGRDTIDYINKVDDLTTYDKIIKDNKVENVEVFEEPGNNNLLHSIQSHIFNLISNSDSNFIKQQIAANDKSVSFNIVYSRRREIEILQDNILFELDNNKNLQPREILILAPDIELYSPHIKAVFGTYNKTDKRYIPFSIADQKRKSFSPIMKAIEILLNLDNINLTSNEIFTLLDAPALRTKFNINTEDLPQLKRAVNQAQIRWGLSAEHREKLNKQFQNNNETTANIINENNTWNSGISRMISGFVFGDISERINDDNFDYWHKIIPLNTNDISGSKINNIANLILLCQQLEKWFDELNKPANVSQWRIRLQTLLDTFFDTDSNVNNSFFVTNNSNNNNDNFYAEEILLLKRFYDCLDNWENDNNLTKQALNLIDENLFTTNNNIENIPLSIVRDYVLSQLDESGLRQPFLGGHLTFATLMPMRSIPYKYIYLIGMNDNEYPRKKPIMDFDLMARYPRFGDRSRREDDRYLFLEAILSAREKLTISYIGYNVRDNSTLEPSVLVSQLQNNILSRFELNAESNNKNLIENITQIFPLQIFSEKYFYKNSDLITYAKEWERNISKNNAENANINTNNNNNFKYLLNKIETIKLADLIEFIKSPIEFYFSHYLKIKFPKYEYLNNNLSDIENFDTNNLENYINRNEIINLLTSKQLANNENINIENLSKKFLSDGRLPWNKAAELKVENLNKQLTKLNAAHNEISLTPDAPKNKELKINTYKLNGDINNLYKDDNGKLYRYYISASNLYKDKKLRIYKILEDVIYHIFANANGLNLTTKILTLNGNKSDSEVKNIVLSADLFSEDECKNLITKCCEFYLQENQPFPIIPEAYFEFLNNQKNDEYTDKYERKKQWNKIAENTTAIRWTFPNYDDITNDKIKYFEDNLYKPIFDKLNTNKTNNSSK